MKVISSVLLTASIANAAGIRRRKALVSSQPPVTPTPCIKSTITFDTDGAGNALLPGAYVGDEWLADFGFTVSAMSSNGGYTPDNMPRLFDTANPGTNNNNGDPDLGAPNQNCGGPGVGSGGAPGKPGENCEEQGLVLIIQESNKEFPDDNAGGGVITFSFESPAAEVISIGLMDVDSNNVPHVDIASSSGNSIVNAVNLGGNSIQTLALNAQDVDEVTVTIPTSGAISHIEVCLDATLVEGSIAGNVSEDTDNDDIGDVNLANVLIRLMDEEGGLVATTATDSDGNYVFVGLSFGQYIVFQKNLDNYVDVSGADKTVVLGPGQAVIGVDFVDERSCDIVKIDFKTDSYGNTLSRGAYVGTEWYDAYLMTVSAMSSNGGYTPDNMPRLFDTANPGTNNNNGDPDLGAPNQNCGGPGVGSGGAPGKPGENCEEQGLVLIIQESNKPDPDDNAGGGVISFDFDSPIAEIISIGLMDVDSRHTPYVDVTSGGTTQQFTSLNLGGNSFQNVDIGVAQVNSVDVTIPTSGAITHIEICVDKDYMIPPVYFYDLS